MAAALILFGAIWIYYATVIPTVMRTRAMSDAMQLEANLKGWASGKVSEGKLTESDVEEIFHETYSLRFGGENSNKDFREIVEHIAQSSAPPIWPGVVMVAVGVVAVCRLPSPPKRKQEAEQGADDQLPARAESGAE